MTTLHREGPMTPGGLASLERVSPASMSRIIKTLNEAEMIIRQPHHLDGRIAVVSLCPAGAAIVDGVNEARHQWLTTQLAQLSESDRDVLRHAVDAIEALLPETPGRRNPRTKAPPVMGPDAPLRSAEDE